MIERNYLLAGVKGQQPVVKVYIEMYDESAHLFDAGFARRDGCMAMSTLPTQPGSSSRGHHAHPHEDARLRRYRPRPRIRRTLLCRTRRFPAASQRHWRVHRHRTPRSLLILCHHLRFLRLSLLMNSPGIPDVPLRLRRVMSPPLASPMRCRHFHRLSRFPRPRGDC